MPTPSDWSQQLRTFVNTRESGRDWPFDKFVLTEQASSWDAYLAWLSELQGTWCFRGQREAWWGLQTSLDREVFWEFSIDNCSGCGHFDRESEGRDLLFRFQQQAHRYISNLPSSEDLSSWFALMQHYGVPTRFLDWTQSPYVAMYFAIEEEPRGREKLREEEQPPNCAVWAINLDWLEAKGHKLLQSKGATPVPDDPKTRAEYLNSLLGQKETPVIVKINPLRTDERMVAKQGLFLCKLYDEPDFDEILMNMMSKPETPDRPVVRKLEVSRNHRIGFLTNLRAMNIHRASLFPGLDGFGQSLRLDLKIKVKVKVTGEELEKKMLEKPAAEAAEA